MSFKNRNQDSRKKENTMSKWTGSILAWIAAALAGSVVLFQVVIKPEIDWSMVKEIFRPKIERENVGGCVLFVDRDTGKTVNKECPTYLPNEKSFPESSAAKHPFPAAPNAYSTDFPGAPPGSTVRNIQHNCPPDTTPTLDMNKCRPKPDGGKNCDIVCRK